MYNNQISNELNDDGNFNKPNCSTTNFNENFDSINLLKEHVILFFLKFCFIFAKFDFVG